MRAAAAGHRTERIEPAAFSLEGLQTWLAALSQVVEWVLLAACGFLLLLLTANVFLEVVIRYVFKVPLPWTEEVARFALVWFGMLAAAAASRKGLHFSFRWGTMLLSPRARRGLRVLVDLMVMSILIVLLKHSLDFLDIVADQTALATEINMRVPFAGLPVGLGAMLLVYALEVADACLSLWTGKRLSAKEAADEETTRQLGHPEDIRSMPLPSAE
jgi:TRAP-type C4-dicarboxylate transport system permease small subunit